MEDEIEIGSFSVENFNFKKKGLELVPFRIIHKKPYPQNHR
jgi:hypothetical protein